MVEERTAKGNTIPTIIVFVALLSAMLFAALFFGRKTMKNEAVEAGVAEWKVIDSAGTVEFRWKAEKR